MRNIFRYQLHHLLSLTILTLTARQILFASEEMTSGSLWNLETTGWFWIALAVPVAHQVYVWFVWRLELFYHVFTNLLGQKMAFPVYAAGFSVLFISRLIFIIFLAISNRDSLDISSAITTGAAILMIPVILYLLYSVRKYFKVSRAFGIDHFNVDYHEPFVKEGIFKYSNNAMYIFGLWVLYIPGLLLQSPAALLAALFNHFYIWVHYYCTERPDMITIYGKLPENS